MFTLRKKTEIRPAYVYLDRYIQMTLILRPDEAGRIIRFNLNYVFSKTLEKYFEEIKGHLQ